MGAGFLLEVSAKSSVMLLLAWSLTHVAAARFSAAARHLVWAAALAGTLAMPAVVRFAPGWRLSPASGTWVSRAGAALDTTWQRRRPRADGEVWPLTAPPRDHAPFTRESGPTAPVPAGADNSGPSSSVWRTAGGGLVVRLWAIGTAIGMTSVLVGLFWAAWLVRRARPVTSPEWLASHAEALRLARISGTVRLLESDCVGVPVVSGLFRPALILPSESSAWDADKRRVVLLHELAHVRRRDCLVQAIAHLAWAAQWCNPLVAMAVTSLRAEQERACDDLVLTMGTRATDYAGHLCDIASMARRPTPSMMWATLAIARPSRLEARVQAILDEARSRRSPTGRFCAAIALVGSAAVVSLGTMCLSGAAAETIGTLPSAAFNIGVPYSVVIPMATHERLTFADAASDPVTAVTSPAPGARPPVQELTAETGQAFLNAYCTACHDASRRTANLVLDRFSPEQIGASPDVWEKVVRRLRAGLHPPLGAPRPIGEAMVAFCSSVEAALDRAELDNWVPGAAEPLGDRAIATRLAKFLWNAEPDGTLLGLAANGRLRDGATLQQQVRRMISDNRSAALMTGFFGDWLSLKRLATVIPDAAVFPEFDDSLREAFGRETELFLASQVREDHSLTDLLEANYTFLNERLARHYGVEEITGGEFRRVSLANDARHGLLGQGSILSVTSFANRTSPVLRGKWLIETWLGSPAPPPPPNVPPLKKDDAEHPQTLRTRMEEHRRNPVCASCHASMDPLGFALENFDAIGRWRTAEAGLPIDTSGVLPDGSLFDGPAQLRSALLKRRDVVISTITLKLLAYALGRPARYSDMPAVRAIMWEAAPSHHSWSSTIAGIVKSPPFQMKRVDATSQGNDR
jgi:beta-lactamase regulating signal transducer with metallopeptidase domain